MRMRTWLGGASVFIVFSWSGGMIVSGMEGKAKTEMQKLLPLHVGSYRSDGKDQFFNRETTFRYMDGAAELYRSYGFRLLLVRRYLRDNSPAVLAELFDMGSSEDAFGVFSFETEGEEMGVGQGSDYGGGLLRFWKGKHFINVYAEQETSSTRENVLGIGRAIAESIKGDGQKPKLLAFLPEEGLVERSVRYFHLNQSLNYHYFVSYENILRLGERTRAVLASYLFQQKDEKTRLLVVQYPTQKLAKGAFRSFVHAYLPESSASRTVRTESGRWTAADNDLEFVVLVFDGPDPEKARGLIEATREKLERKRP